MAKWKIHSSSNSKGLVLLVVLFMQRCSAEPSRQTPYTKHLAVEDNAFKHGDIIKTSSSNNVYPFEPPKPTTSSDSLKGESLKEDVDKILKGYTPKIKEDDDKDETLVNKVLSIMQISKNNADVITQAFRFVRLDAHLSTLLQQLSQLRESQDALQTESVKQQTKFNIVLDEIRSLAANVAKESIRLTEIEERLESEIEVMNDRIDSSTEKIIQSAVSTQLLLDLSKETIQQTDKSVGISNEILMELKNVRTELGDVGQASVQTIYNVQKLEESLLMAMEETNNKTIYALRQDQQVQYQLLPSATKMDLEEVSLVPLGNGRVGNSIQADGTISPEPTSLPAHTFAKKGPSTQNVAHATPIFAKKDDDEEKNEEEEKWKQTAQQNNVQHMKGNDATEAGSLLLVRDIGSGMMTTTTTTTPVKSGSSSRSTTGKSMMQESLVSPCSSFHERRISPERPRNCEEIQITGHSSSGVYRIFPFDSIPAHNGTEVYCDLITDGGGWTVIQRRKEPLLIHEDFEKSWSEYASGFGILHDSHWIGLDTIAEMTKSGDFELRVDLSDWEGESRFAKYSYFRVGNATELYRLYITDFSGNAGDSLSYHNAMAFTTKDRDNDMEGKTNCAIKYHGAWWYNKCHLSNLNGQYMDSSNGNHDSYANGVNWYSWHGYYYSLKRTEMKIRSRHFNEIITH